MCSALETFERGVLQVDYSFHEEFLSSEEKRNMFRGITSKAAQYLQTCYEQLKKIVIKAHSDGNVWTNGVTENSTFGTPGIDILLFQVSVTVYDIVDGLIYPYCRSQCVD